MRRCEPVSHKAARGTSHGRSIKTLHNFERPATDVEIPRLALQFVRKLSGFARAVQD